MACTDSKYFDGQFLLDHVRSIQEFYYPRCMDYEDGGYINQLRDDGSVFDRKTKHLVGTCRFIYGFSTSGLLLGEGAHLDAAAHGLEFLQDGHWDAKHGGYFWILDGRSVRDDTKHCYGHAFVLLALAGARKAGLVDDSHVRDAFDLLERTFWEPEHGLYSDQSSADWSRVEPYRGQNANMHMCEAMIAAYEATDDSVYLRRARDVAHRICVDLASQANGLIWEHYTSDWTIDWEYNADDPRNLFRPYGFLPGHFTEWSKLLLILERHSPEPWMANRATQLFDVALDRSWDEERGGMYYTFDREGSVLDRDRYYWVLAETIAAAALLGSRLDSERHCGWYDRLWSWSLDHLVDQDYGGWYRILDQENQRYDDLKSPASKTDYHPLAACFEIYRQGKGVSAG